MPVDLSGLIFVALALVWALVLIPKALHNHDDAARTRSVDHTSDDARVLTRRTTPAAPTPAAPAPPARDLGIARQRQRTAARAAARRRRRVLAVLLAATAVVAGTTVAGLTLVWAPAIPATLVVSFLALARVLVRREHATWDTLVAELGPRDDAEDEAEQPQPELTVVARNDQGVAVVSDQEDTSSLDVSSLRASHLWDPLPMTLPTYVDKPRATRSVRTIDLQGAGVASSGHDAAASALVAEAATAGQQEPPEQRAVGS